MEEDCTALLESSLGVTVVLVSPGGVFVVTVDEESSVVVMTMGVEDRAELILNESGAELGSKLESIESKDDVSRLVNVDCDWSVVDCGKLCCETVSCCVDWDAPVEESDSDAGVVDDGGGDEVVDVVVVTEKPVTS